MLVDPVTHSLDHAAVEVLGRLAVPAGRGRGVAGGVRRPRGAHVARLLRGRRGCRSARGLARPPSGGRRHDDRGRSASGRGFRRRRPLPERAVPPDRGGHARADVPHADRCVARARRHARCRGRDPRLQRAANAPAAVPGAGCQLAVLARPRLRDGERTRPFLPGVAELGDPARIRDRSTSTPRTSSC